MRRSCSTSSCSSSPSPRPRLSEETADAPLAAALAAPSAAQTFPTDDPVLGRIWALGMDSSQTYRLAQVLLDSIGPRLTGTPGQRAGNEWLLPNSQGGGGWG